MRTPVHDLNADSGGSRQRDSRWQFCVAFVGAGFSAAVIPPWAELLRGLATESAVGEDVEDHVESLVLKGSAHTFDEADQVLEDQLGREAFLDQLESLLTQRDERPMCCPANPLPGPAPHPALWALTSVSHPFSLAYSMYVDVRTAYHFDQPLSTKLSD